MQRRLCMLAIGIGTNALAAVSALAQGAPAAAPEVTLTRLECGTARAPTDVGARTGAGLRFSDTYDFDGLRVQLVFSCYLIKHGDDYMVWDAGFGKGAGAVAPKETALRRPPGLHGRPSRDRFAAGLSGFFTLIQSSERLDR